MLSLLIPAEYILSMLMKLYKRVCPDEVRSALSYYGNFCLCGGALITRLYQRSCLKHPMVLKLSVLLPRGIVNVSPAGCLGGD